MVGTDALARLITTHDKDGDGKLSVQEVQSLLKDMAKQGALHAFAGQAAALPAPEPPATTPARPQEAAASPVSASSPMRPPSIEQHWDQRIEFALEDCRATGTSLLQLVRDFAADRLNFNHKRKVPLSELIWSALGAFCVMYLLGTLAQSAALFPHYGIWHKKGLNLLLGSFGTLTMLLFCRPAGEPVKVWNIVCGQMWSVLVVMTIMGVMGPGVLSRAVAFAVAVVGMIWLDCFHPPGGALILVAEDSAVVQAMRWEFMVYPSVALTLLLVLPIAAIINRLKRTVKFDFPEASESTQAEGQQQGSSGSPLKPKLA